MREALSLLEGTARAKLRNVQVGDSSPAEEVSCGADQASTATATPNRLPAAEDAHQRRKHLNLVLAIYGLGIAAAAAQAKGAFDGEIVAMSVEKEVVDRQSGAKSLESLTIGQDEGVRADTTREKLAALKPVQGEGSVVTAGNACQLSDGASACVIMTSGDAEKRGLKPLGLFRGFAVAGCEPDEMGIGPVFAVPKLLRRHG